MNEKGGCGAIWWLDVWYSAKSGILFDCRAYYWVVQNVIPDWHRFLKWECGLYLLCGCVGLWLYDCGAYAVICPTVALLACTVIMEAYTFICCDLLYSFNVVLSAVICGTVVVYGAMGLLQWFSMSASPEAMQNTFFLIYVVGCVWSFDCVVYWACVCCYWYILVF